MKHSLAIAALVLMTTQAGAASLMPSAKDTYEPSLYDNCNGLGWKKAFECASISSQIRKELRDAAAAEANARRAYDELNRKAFEAEAVFHKAKAEALIAEWRKFKQ